jgi:type III restriction enzyme
MPYEEKEIVLRVKPTIKKTEFWDRGFLFVNEKVEADRIGIKTIDDIDIEKTYKYKLPTGFVKEDTILKEGKSNEKSFETTTKIFRLDDFGDKILRKAMAKLDFYRFNNLKKYFPSLTSSREFIDSLRNITVDITSSREKLDNLTPEDKLKVCLNVLIQLKNEILNEYVEYKGTEVFIPKKIKEIVMDKQLKINVGDYGDQEYGVPMSNPKHPEYTLNLQEKEWYVYDENYGTSEEKSFVKFIDGIIEELRKKYSEVYLLRNASLFKIYRFSDGKAMEPDFVLFLKKNSDEIEQYQLFIETKGEHLIKTDQWKEDFLKEIEEKYQIKIEPRLFGENEKYKLIGFPFYNEGRKSQFIEVFKEKLELT